MNSSDRSAIRTTLLVLGTIVGVLIALWVVVLVLHVAL